MSIYQPSSSTDNKIRNSKFTIKRSSTPEQDPIDRRLNRLKEEVLPFYPFLLTVPTDVPFRLGSRFVNNWAVGNDGPFTPEEQQLQYMTFLTHHEGDSLLVAVGDWSDGTGNIMSDQRSVLQSAASTPSSGPLKKKISLNDYKNKRKSGASASPISHETSSQTSATTHMDKQQSSKANSTKDNVERPPPKALPPKPPSRFEFENVERKRPPELDHEHLKLLEGKHTDIASSKRPRLSPERTTKNKAERSKPHELPALLSPTLPPTSDSLRLPRLLSPTLPPDIEKELAKLSEEHSSRKSLKTTSSKENVQKAKQSDRSRPQFDSGHGSSLHSKFLNQEADKHMSTSLDSANSDFSDSPNADLPPQRGDKLSQLADARSNHHSSSTKLQRLVKLRYGRSNRKRVEALLKFSGKRKVAPTSPPLKEPVDHQSFPSTKVEQNAPRTLTHDHTSHKPHRLEGKSKHAVSDETTVPLRERSKEPRVPLPEKPRTPVPSISNSTPRQQEKMKQASTPTVKEFGESTVRTKPAGSDGKSSFQAVTPSGDSATITKQSPSQPNNQLTRPLNSDRRAWKEEFQKYSNLGRELKHTAERHTAKDSVTAVDEKLAAATAIEAIICFILAFVADDQSKTLARQVGDSSTWLSILAYWRVVKKNCAPYSRLHSLCLILGAVSYDTIHAHDLERLAITPLPGEHTPVPTPGSDGNTIMSDENKRNRKEFLELKNRLPECYKESQRLWLEGSQGLSEDILLREFPKTWSKRSRNYSEQGKQRLKIADYSGEYFLPLGRTITPIETVRFSCAILKEWCAKEGVEWSSRLGL